MTDASSVRKGDGIRRLSTSPWTKAEGVPCLGRHRNGEHRHSATRFSLFAPAFENFGCFLVCGVTAACYLLVRSSVQESVLLHSVEGVCLLPSSLSRAYTFPLP